GKRTLFHQPEQRAHAKPVSHANLHCAAHGQTARRLGRAFHVTRGGEVVVLCDEQIYAPSATPTITPTLTPTPTPTFTMTPTRTPRSMIFQTNTPRAATLTATLEHDVCLSLLPSRLTAGEQRRIAQQCP